jgi:hypothetical protein
MRRNWLYRQNLFTGHNTSTILLAGTFGLSRTQRQVAARLTIAAGPGCNAKANRRYLLEGRALDPKRQRLLLVPPGETPRRTRL